MVSTPVPEPRDGTWWGSDADRGTVAEFARDIATRAGFGFCAVHVLRADQTLELVAVHGSGEVPDRRVGLTYPLAMIQPVLDCGVQYADLVFVAQEWLSPEASAMLDRNGYARQRVADPKGDAWRGQDLLVVRLCDSDDGLRGLLHLDAPLTGRRPTREEILTLSETLHATFRAVLTAIEREELAQSARMAAAARKVIRQAGAEMTLDELLRLASEQLRDGFRALEVQLHVKPYGGYASTTAFGGLAEVATAIAAAVDHAWRHQTVVIVEPEHVYGDGGHLAEAMGPIGVDMKLRGVGMTVLVPLGTPETFLGMMVIVRAADSQSWSESESEAAREVAHDLTRAALNARAHEREQAWAKELRRLDLYRGQMVSTVTHELRNPLGVILGHLELLEEHSDIPDTWLRSLLAMRRAATRLDGLSNDLLTLNRLDASDTPRVTEPVDLAQVVEEAVELAALEAARREIAVVIQHGDGPFVVRGDQNELSRVVTNLLSNAIKYSDPGHQVTLGLATDEGAVVLFCRDEGIGISEADQAVLFEEFFRSTNSAALERPGTGLGLPIVRRIVRRHGGRVTFTSALGEGTTFTVLLPRPLAAVSPPTP